MRYMNLETIYKSKSQKHIGVEKPIVTKLDKSLLDSINLYQTASRLEDVNILLQYCITLLMDTDASSAQKNQTANNIQKLIVPLNGRAVELLGNAAKSVAPMAGCRDVHMKWEVERKQSAQKEIIKWNKKAKKVTIEMKLIGKLLNHNSPSSTADDLITLRKKKLRMATVTGNKNESDEVIGVTLPLPANTTTMVYSKPEVVRILGQAKKGMKQRAVMMKEMTKRTWVPTSDSTLRRLMQMEDQGNPILDTNWAGIGHRRRRKQQIESFGKHVTSNIPTALQIISERTN